MKRKIRKFGGGGTMGSKDRGYQGGGRDSKGNVSGDAPGAGGSTKTGGGGNKNIKTTHTKNQFKTRDVPFSKPFGYKSQIAASLIGLGPITTAGNFVAKQNYKARQKFATKEGLARDFYRTENKALKPNSPIGKDYLKSAGYGKNKISPVIEGGNDSSTILPMEVTKPIDPLLIKPKENFFNFVAYKVGGLSGGVSYGPPPKKGPNSNVPPVKMKKGGYKK